MAQIAYVSWNDFSAKTMDEMGVWGDKGWRGHVVVPAGNPMPSPEDSNGSVRV